ncbi:hypothetical protein C8R43DRAFT_948172 [Mycena crocata]|nr:hypothetical protein C8R43DRAFT_948172 [Mycena crocata]
MDLIIDINIAVLKFCLVPSQPAKCCTDSSNSSALGRRKKNLLIPIHIVWDESRRPPTSERVEISWVLPNNNDPIYFPLPSVVLPESSTARPATDVPAVSADATAVAPIPEPKDKVTARGIKRKVAGESEEPASKHVRKTKELVEGSAPRRSKRLTKEG